MKHRSLQLMALLITLVLVAAPGVATSPPGIPEPPPGIKKKLDAIAAAARSSDVNAREQALREAIRDGLLSPDAAVRKEVFSYLCEMSHRWLDLRPFFDVIEEYGRLFGEKQIAWALDEAEYRLLPRETRLALCRQAIVDGEARGPHGRPWPRVSGMGLAATDGLAELLPLIEEYHSALGWEDQKAAPISRLRLELSLRAGATDREDALRLAALRLAKLEDCELEQRMEQDTIFRQTILQTARDACAINPFTGERNLGCAAMHEVARRQKRLHAERQAEARAAGAEPEPQELGGPGTWLDQLVDASRLDPVIPPDQAEEVRRTRRLPTPKPQ